MYGTNWLLWATNTFLGNDGSIFHFVFWVSLQVQRFVPLVSLYLIFMLNASYLPSDSSYNYWSALASASTKLNTMKYLFNPG
jgi:hypothetical protein